MSTKDLTQSILCMCGVLFCLVIIIVPAVIGGYCSHLYDIADKQCDAIDIVLCNNPCNHTLDSHNCQVWCGEACENAKHTLHNSFCSPISEAVWSFISFTGTIIIISFLLCGCIMYRSQTRDRISDRILLNDSEPSYSV